MSGLRLGFGVFLLPLIVRMPRNDQGFYQILMALLTAVPILDMGLSTAVERGVSYAMGGARDLQAFGVHDQTTHAAPAS